MNDRIIARLRTAVPAAWGALITALVLHIPSMPEFIVDFLNSEATVIAVVGLVTLGWHWLWTRFSHLIPAWLETIVMGHVGEPVYEGTLDGLINPEVVILGPIEDDIEFDNPDSPQFDKEVQ